MLATPGIVGLEPTTSGFGAGQSFGQESNKSKDVCGCRGLSRRRFSDVGFWEIAKQSQHKTEKNAFVCEPFILPYHGLKIFILISKQPIAVSCISLIKVLCLL